MWDCSPSERERALRALLPAARERAAEAGRKHWLWDAISDAGHVLDGGRTVIRFRTRAEGIERLLDLLKAETVAEVTSR